MDFGSALVDLLEALSARHHLLRCKQTVSSCLLGSDQNVQKGVAYWCAQLPQIADFYRGEIIGLRRLFESEIQLKIIEPGDVGIDAVGLQLGWQILVVGSEHLDIGCIVVGDDDGIVVDANISIQSSEEVLS